MSSKFKLFTSSVLRAICAGVPEHDDQPSVIHATKVYDTPDMRPPAMPPVKVGRPCCAAFHCTGPGFVTLSDGLIAYTVWEFDTSDASTGPGELVLKPGGAGPGLATGVVAGGGAPLATALCFSANSRSCSGRAYMLTGLDARSRGDGMEGERTWRICCWLSFPSFASWPSCGRLVCRSFAI